MQRTRDHPWFAPLYRRVLLVAAIAGWTGFELFREVPDELWTTLAILALLWSIWDLFLEEPVARLRGRK